MKDRKIFHDPSNALICMRRISPLVKPHSVNSFKRGAEIDPLAPTMTPSNFMSQGPKYLRKPSLCCPYFRLLNVRAVIICSCDSSYGTCASSTSSEPAFFAQRSGRRTTSSRPTIRGSVWTTCPLLFSRRFTPSSTLLWRCIRKPVIAGHRCNMCEIVSPLSPHRRHDGIDCPLPLTRVSPHGRVWVRSLLAKTYSPPRAGPNGPSP